MPVSPVGSGLTQGRVDQGVDWSLAPGQSSAPLYAVDSGTITSVSNAGWPGGAFIVLELDHPVDPQHSSVYYAEDINAAVQVGQKVSAGQLIGNVHPGENGIELGWQGGGRALAGEEGQFTGSNATPEGQHFLNWIAGSQTPPGNASAGVPAPAPTTSTAGQSGPGNDKQSAYTSVATQLQQYGLGDLSGWAWGEVVGGANADQVLIDLQNQPEFKARFPGLELRKQNGFDAITPAQYLAYEDQAQQLARAAGLPAGFMTRAEMAQLIGNDVSATELNDRITKGYEAATNADPVTKQLLQAWFGTPADGNGALAAFYLDPTKAVPMLENQLQAAQIGAAAKGSGFGDIGAYLAQMMEQQGISVAQARTGFKALAPLTPLETPLPGQPNMPSVSQAQLVGDEFHGNGTAEVQAAQQARQAGFAGGGGVATTTKGAVGAGSAGQQGA